MSTQEERIVALEETAPEYRPVLQNFAYELTLVKGLIVDQTRITQELRRDVTDIKGRLTQIEQKLNTILTLLKPS